MSRSEQVVEALALRKQTPLYPAHRALGARMVDFGGWDMPVHYSSQIEEHHAVRRDAGMFDVSHMRVLDVQGENARAFLREALANNVDKLEVAGKALYSCLLRPDGGVIDDLIVYFMHENAFRLVVNAGTAEKDIAWLRELMAVYAGTVQLTVRDDLAIIAVQGPRARERVWQTLPDARAATEYLKPFSAIEAGALFIARTGYTGEDGFEIMLPAARAPAVWQALATAGVRPCGLGARDTLRLEAGMNLYGQDMDETVSPLVCGLKWTVDLASERDFIGKTALLPKKIECHQVGLILLEPGGVLRSHQKLDTPEGAGEITSGTFSPTLNRSIALARVPLSIRSGDTVKVAVRDKLLAVRVVKPPFVRGGRVLIDLQESS